MRRAAVLLPVLSLASLQLPRAALGAPLARGAQWQQDRFVISFCNDPIVSPDQFAYRACVASTLRPPIGRPYQDLCLACAHPRSGYQEIADANFTLVSSSAWLTPGAARRWDAPTRMAGGLQVRRTRFLFSHFTVQPESSPH